MLRPLVTKRFLLKTHTESRLLPVYELVVVKGGPKCKLSEDQTKLGWGDIGLYYNKGDIKLDGRTADGASGKNPRPSPSHRG